MKKTRMLHAPVCARARDGGLSTLVMAVALALGAHQGQTQAQTPPAIQISAQPLASALLQLGEQADLQIFFSRADVDGRQAGPLSGQLSPDEALRRLLAGTGIEFRRAGRNVSLSRPSDATQLEAVTVHGRRDSLPQVYEGGQVAAGGRVGLLGDKDFMETPFSTISYTEKFIADRQARDITDVIAATDPAVFATGVTGIIAENYSIRGFSSSTNDVSFNGLYGVSPFYRASPEMFERIEVLKGPSALLNAMPPGGSVGGAVNLVPKRAGEEPLASVTASYMANSQFGGHVDLGSRFGEDKQFGIRFNGVYREGESAIKQQDKKTQLASLGLDWRGERTRVSADLYASEERVDGPTRGINLAPGVDIPKPPRPDTLLNPSWAFFDTRDQGAMVRGEFDVNESLTVYAAAGASKTQYKTTSVQTVQVFNAAGDYRTNASDLLFEVDKRSAEAGVRGRFQTGAIGHQWSLSATHYAHTDEQFGRRNVLGADWVTNIYDPAWGPAPSSFSAPAISKTKLRLNSVGLADTVSFAQDRVQLTLGLRHQTVVSDTFDVRTGDRTSRYDQSATTPAVALLVQATDRLSFYMNYIEGLSQGSTAPMTAANAGEVFAPFKTRQKEVGLKLDLGEFAHTLSLYEIKRPSSYTDPYSNVFSFGGEQRNRGVEWTFFGSLTPGLRLMGGVAYLDPKLTRSAGGLNQGNMAAGLPRLQAKLGLEWDVPGAQGLTLTANATSVSRQYINADNSQSVPGRTIYDLGARYATKVSGRPLTLRASVANVGNKAYWAMPQWTSLGLGAPRTVMLSATMDF
ncbi:TonB-dependent siderophore receptor [Alcaligenes sp. WGS1538]|uniref:TonB-dependent siderophore receptor n=1 Tax=Alcaligenes sp. WGS1538 TaxID=3366811 RepID=UPI00372D81E2